MILTRLCPPRTRTPLRSALCVLLTASLLVPALAADPAALAPRNSALAVGWSKPAGPSHEGVQYFRDFIAGLERQIAADNPDEGLEFGRVMRILTTAVEGTGAVAFLQLPKQGEMSPQIMAVLEDIADPRKFVADCREALVASGEWTAEEARVADVEAVAAKMESGPTIYFGTVGQRVVAGMGETAFAAALATARGQSGSLASVDEFKTDRERVGAYRGMDETTFFYADLAYGVEWLRSVTASDREAPQIARAIEELGLSELRSLYWSHAASRDCQSGVLYLHTGSASDRGVLKLARQKPLDRDLLKLVPHNAHWMYAGSLDVLSIWTESMRIAEIFDPTARGQVESAVGMTREIVGFSPVDELFPILGNDWLFFDAPDHGGFLVTGIVMVVTSSEGAKLNDMISRIAEWLSPLLSHARAVLKQVETPRDGRKIHTWVVAGLPIPVAPSWTVFGKRCAFALHPQTIATAMRQFDEKTRGPSIAEHADLNAVLDKWPKDLTAVGYFDSAGLIRFGYPLWNLLQNAIMSMQAGGAENPVNLEMFPTLPDLVAQAKPAIGGSWHTEDGVYVAYTGTAGGPAIQMAMSPIGTAALVAAVALPSFERAREVAAQTQAMNQAKQIAIGCQIYSSDNNGKFPESLDVLIEKGIVKRENLASPRGWGNDAGDYGYIAGQTWNSDKENVLCYETVGGDDRAVAFVDGHVERLSYAELQQRVRETYKRLNRINDLPPEFAETSGE